MISGPLSYRNFEKDAYSLTLQAYTATYIHTYMFLFGVLYKDSTLTTISK